MDKLITDLTTARHIYAKDSRLGAAFAVDALVQHLEALGIDPQLRAPLVGLSGALVDATRGVHNDLIAVEKPRLDGPRRPIQEDISKAWAAAAVTLLTMAGDSLPQALNRVAPLVGMSSSELKNFRKRLTREGSEAARREVREIYNKAVAGRPNVPGLSMQDTAHAAAHAAVITLRQMASENKRTA